MKRLLALFIALFALLMAPVAQADDALTPGGVIVVDGHTLASHFARRGNGMLFPLVEVASALGKSATIEGDKATLNGHSVPVVMFDGKPYVDYRDLMTLLPELHFGATADRAVFSTRVASAPPVHPPSGAQTQDNGGVQIVSQDLNLDPARDNKLTVQVTLMNNTGKQLPANLVCQLLFVDTQGTTGGGPNKIYAVYEQPLGDMPPSQVRQLTYETDIRNPDNFDKLSQRVSLDVNGFEMNATHVDLVYQFKIGEKK